jgi:hypothetical protein
MYSLQFHKKVHINYKYKCAGPDIFPKLLLKIKCGRSNTVIKQDVLEQHQEKRRTNNGARRAALLRNNQI